MICYIIYCILYTSVRVYMSQIPTVLVQFKHLDVASPRSTLRHPTHPPGLPPPWPDSSGFP